MTAAFPEEIAANLERAEKSVQAARQLVEGGFYDFAASRAYYEDAVQAIEAANDFVSTVKVLLD